MNTTKQPEWEYICNIGDASPLDYGGAFVFRDKTGVYGVELEVYEPDEGEEEFFDEEIQETNTRSTGGNVYQIMCEKMVDSPYGLISAYIWGEHTTGKPLPHAISEYVEWFDKDPIRIADIREDFTSDDPRTLASAYLELAREMGYEKFDSDPIHITLEEARVRYADILNKH